MGGQEGRWEKHGERHWTSSFLPLGRESPGIPSMVEYYGCLLECMNQARLPKCFPSNLHTCCSLLWVTAHTSNLPKQARELHYQLTAPSTELTSHCVIKERESHKKQKAVAPPFCQGVSGCEVADWLLLVVKFLFMASSSLCLPTAEFHWMGREYLLQSSCIGCALGS